MRWLRVSRTKSPEMLRPEQVKSISARLAAAVIQNVDFSSRHQDEKHSGGLSGITSDSNDSLSSRRVVNEITLTMPCVFCANVD
jgi:hypothetical protein